MMNQINPGNMKQNKIPNEGLSRAYSAIFIVVVHLYKIFNTLVFLSTREIHVNTNILNYYVFKCIPCMYDNINK